MLINAVGNIYDGKGTVNIAGGQGRVNGIMSKSNASGFGGTNIESGLERASEQMKTYLEQAQKLYDPYVQSGTQSLNEYMKLLTGGVDALSGDQNFQALQDLAEKKVMSNRAVSGLLRSGATASALDDTLLNFANTYYNNRLSQLGQGVALGQYGTTASAGIYDKFGANATDLASALANIQMQREANDATIKAAQAQAQATKDAAKSASKSSLVGGLMGAVGSLAGAYFGGPAGASIGGSIGSKIGSSF